MPAFRLLAILGCLSWSLCAPAAEDLGIRVPPGFEVSLYADDALAHDIYSMTVDAQGRVVVAGAGYVKTLHDSDGDGRADRATLFSSLPASGAHGMYFDGPDLICTGDNSVMRLRDTDGDGTADGEPEVWTSLRHPEHGANGIVRGPDGCYYLICGNDAGVSERQITTVRSPVAHPRCGGIVRFQPRASRSTSWPTAFAIPTISTSTPPATCSPSTPTASATTTCRGMRRRDCSTSPRAWSTAGCCKAGRAAGTGRRRSSTTSNGWSKSAAARRPAWSCIVIARFRQALSGRRVFGLLDPRARSTSFRSKPRARPAQPARNLHGNHRRRRLRTLRPGHRTDGRSVRRHRRTTNTRQRVSRARKNPDANPRRKLTNRSIWRACWRPINRCRVGRGPVGRRRLGNWARRPSKPLPKTSRCRLRRGCGPSKSWSSCRAGQKSNGPVASPRTAARNCVRASPGPWRARRICPKAQQILARLTADADPGVQRAAWESLAVADEIDPSAQPAARLGDRPGQSGAARACRGDRRGTGSRPNELSGFSFA